MATYRTPRGPDPKEDGFDYSTIGKPTPRHAQTKAARKARRSQRAAYHARRQLALTAAAEAATTPSVAPKAERVDPATLGGSPSTLARKLAVHGAEVAATRSPDGAVCSVWALRGSLRLRAFYRRTPTGTWSTWGALLGGQPIGVTAALAAFSE